MDDATAAPQPVCLQRAVGELAVSLKRRGAASVLDGLRQVGCLKARLPRPTTEGWADVVTLNTSGGVVGGDRLDSCFEVQRGARTTIAAQAAERFYRSVPGGAPSVVRTRIVVQAGGALEWLPQESILFNRCMVDRRLEVDVAPDGWFLGVELLVFGRAAMGERVQLASLRDLIRVRRGGALVLHDAIRLDGDVDAALQRPAIAGGARAVATLVHVAPAAETRLTAVRDALQAVNSQLAPIPGAGGVRGKGRVRHLSRDPVRHCAARKEVGAASQSSVEAAASAWDGLLLARILASDGATLRRAILAPLRVLREARPLPRVWMC